MIVDNLSNAANYFNLHPLFEKAFEYVKSLNMNAVETGTVEIEGAYLKASVVKTQLKNKENAQLETHKKFIDIQIPIDKPETFGWKSLSDLQSSEAGYDAENDFELWKDTSSTFVTLQPGEFVIFSPEDGHAPLIGEGETTKMIIKVAVI